ncbi:pimeloyl-ACP methyl ester esterase BioH [Providencia vermicola]|uniref:Pimeloyl-[acyl-carrier protein] methyl ester esterase n=2 Tax=Providencia TaxID=586 RepID=A0AAI9HY49_PROST|nr:MULTISPECIES: pimeloyl-ACP methyl ester esterase BioH [Providencia]ELR5042831.1 pimeloyl-ACP methyl ester esterase BioH [Providencia rettgeri]ELR5034774.1 pimeloyl-ACP methyl ester esterase BioH [Providencia stuartii]ELR5122477.1 pimeloyl-ACP methyl ester esterase BioH [Providencia stuartii]ELR5143742.1 pimeloyl-ACP methyl ester esterase BioH [Providencia stuartii]ELR5292770.1 pimeloyl-ACP methyl ester esterase BioH [Providencia stuartii]
MTQLYWETIGEGSQDLVLLHGWGLNAEVWRSIIPRIAPHFRLHLVDMPGYGRSQGFEAMDLQTMANTLWQNAPEGAIWLGWSLGGLVASRIALDHPFQIKGLITVASSPCFQAHASDWPGIRSEVLVGFEHQLATDFQRTVERFLALQTLGTESARNDARLLKAIVTDQPVPKVETLNAGLEMLRVVDLRDELKQLTVPFLRLYGYLDGLVPRKVAALLDDRYPNSPSVVMRHSAHAPFISHPDEFCEYLLDFLARLEG